MTDRQYVDVYRLELVVNNISFYSTFYDHQAALNVINDLFPTPVGIYMTKLQRKYFNNRTISWEWELV